MTEPEYLALLADSPGAKHPPRRTLGGLFVTIALFVGLVVVVLYPVVLIGFALSGAGVLLGWTLAERRSRRRRAKPAQSAPTVTLRPRKQF